MMESIMELYHFGIVYSPRPRPMRLSDMFNMPTILTPMKRFSHKAPIRILYQSWCDALILTDSVLNYVGTGLSQSQYDHLEASYAARGPSRLYEELHFFANPLGEGLRCIYEPGRTQSNSTGWFEFFNSTFLQRKFGAPGNEAYRGPAELDIKGIAIASSGRVAVYLGSEGESIKLEEFDCEARFEDWVRAHAVPDSALLHPIRPNQTGPQATASNMFPPSTQQQIKSSLIATSTTFFLLIPTGNLPNKSTLLYSWTPDPRYRKILGRPITLDTPAGTPCPIPYLSETHITKVACGGWLAAAISLEGELYVWGEGVGPSLRPEEEIFEFLKDTGEEGEDEFIKVVDVKIDGQPARVTNVGVGIGHIVIAAETDENGGNEKKRAVFAAGKGESGQLGLGESVLFVGKLTEVPEFRGRVVREIGCAGWSTWVVVDSVEQMK
ncbi:hypothetical protein GQ43DRAFT_266688 [Delitschia confertaspora ATCC 74209]|uniref:Regulator of chromosome condensation (RCC1) n=1 Tax=Delitschia confertaspora ATCC 74209 TaxID=1513339 RepID=A0A9P4MMT0_9PLEO|nr:hypothetical protein GQ43DRAFT_266688 [Delitschia confertaspora ATCC 74209]